MLTKSSVKILKLLVSKGIFQDIYDGANLIICLVPYPTVLQAYLESIESNKIICVDSMSSQVMPFGEENPSSKSEMGGLQAETRMASISESARQAILDLNI